MLIWLCASERDYLKVMLVVGLTELTVLRMMDDRGRVGRYYRSYQLKAAWIVWSFKGKRRERPSKTGLEIEVVLATEFCAFHHNRVSEPTKKLQDQITDGNVPSPQSHIVHVVIR